MAAVLVARRRNYLARERVFKDRLNPLDCLSDEELIARYRLSRECILDLLGTITDELQHPTSRGHAISPIIQLTTALRFYATGCFQREVADLHGISMSSVSRCISSVSRAIAMKVKDYILIVLGFNDTSTLVGHFVSSPREREKRDRRDSRRGEKEVQGRKRDKSESEETEEIKTFPLYPYLLQGQQALPNCKPISVGRPGDVRYTTPLHHPTTPGKII